MTARINGVIGEITLHLVVFFHHQIQMEGFLQLREHPERFKVYLM